MHVTCSHCGARYNIPDDKIRASELKFRCRRCQQVVVTATRRKASSRSSTRPAKPAGPGKEQWYFGLDGNELGPLNLQQAARLMAQGRIGREHFVWREGLDDWLPIEKVPQVARLLPPARPPAPAPSRSASATRSARAEDETQFEGSGGSAPSARKSESRPAGQPRIEARHHDEGDDERKQLLLKVARKRQVARAERHADRIAEHFFTLPPAEDRLLPPPPLEDAEAVAAELEQQAEDDAGEASDPLAVLMEREQPLEREISKVTKVLADQAGLGTVHKGKRLGLTIVAIAAVAGMLGGVIWLGATQGWFRAIGIGRKVPRQQKQTARISLDDIKLTPEEAQRLRRMIFDQKRREQSVATPAGNGGEQNLPKAPPPASEEEKQLLAFYRQQSAEKKEFGPATPRGLDSAAAPALADLPELGGSGVALEKGLAAKPEVRPTGPAEQLGPQGLTELQVKIVLANHRNKIRRCFERQLKRDSRLTGKLLLVVRVNPNGTVERARVDTPRFHGSIVEECLLREVKSWRFPSFSGEAYELSFPLLLSARESY